MTTMTNSGRRGLSALLLVVACLFALLPAFHHHQLNLGRPKASITSALHLATMASAEPIAAIQAARAADTHCAYCEWSSQTPLPALGSTHCLTVAGLSEETTLNSSIDVGEIQGPQQPRAPPQEA